MGFDANGAYTRDRGPDTWQKDAAAGTKIRADYHDQHDADIGSALSDCLNRRGLGGALANISWNNHKITNLLEPSALNDAANWDSVLNIEGWPKSKYISGADLNGRLNFTALSGVNGITWNYVDVSWVARKGKSGEGLNRLVMNNSDTPPTVSTIGPGTVGDVFFVDESGRVGSNTGQFLQNLSYDGSTFRTISGSSYGGLINIFGGDFSLMSNDAASAVNPYSAVTLRSYITAKNEQGSTVLNLHGSASGKTMSYRSYMGSELRWIMYMGDGAAESSTWKGSNFALWAYDNTGANPRLALKIDRELGLATLGGDVTVSGDLKTVGTTTTATYYYSSTTTAILQAAAGGQIVLRPDGTDATKQLEVSNTGTVAVCSAIAAAAGGIFAGAGIRSKLGSAGAYGDEYMNWNWTGTVLNAYVNTGLIGAVTGAWCDHRIKKDIAPLPSLWDRVKALKPISYTQREFSMFRDDDQVQWGFLAHEVQDSLGQTLASGVKDGDDIQGLNLLGVIAGLTRALQEAMDRIEALEAAP